MRPLALPEFCGAPAHRVVETVLDVEPDSKKGMAPSKRSHRLFEIDRPAPHGSQNNPQSLKSGSQRGVRP